MPVSNGIITAPISIRDAYDCLGVGPLILPDGNSCFDVGHICSNVHGRINPWSRHKPVIIDKPNDLTELEFEDQPNHRFGFSKDAPSFPNVPEFGAYDNNEGWVYPLSNVSSFKRLTDFVKYNHYAEPMLKLHIDQISDELGYSIYRLRYMMPYSEIDFREFFRYNSTNPNNPWYRIFFLYRERDNTPFKYILSKPLHLLEREVEYSISLQAKLPGHECEVFAFMRVGYNEIPSEDSNIHDDRLLHNLIPLKFTNAPLLEYVKRFTNASGTPRPIFLNTVDLYARTRQNFPSISILRFSFYFKRATDTNVTVNLADYTLILEYRDNSGGTFRLIPESINTNTITRNDMVGSASTNGPNEVEVSATFTDYPTTNSQFKDSLVHSFSSAFASDGYPRELIKLTLINRATKESVLYASIDYHNAIF